MDIRRFFGGGGGQASAKPKGPSSTKATKNTSEKSKKADTTKPKTKTPTKDKSKVEKTSSKSVEVVVIDSETEEPPIKVQQQKVESVNNNGKVVEKKAKTKEVKVTRTETSPSEKENKKTQDKEVKEKEQKKGGNKTVKSEDKGEKDKSKRGASTERKADTSKAEKDKSRRGASTERKADTSKAEKSEEKKGGKRKSAIRVESSDEEETFAVKRKAPSSSKGKSRKGARIFDSDSDDDVVPPTPVETKSASRKKHKVFVSDSDEEEKQMSISEAFRKVTKVTPKNKTKSAEKPKMKSCSLTDFFGASPAVTRVERKVLPVKRKAVSSPQKQSSFDNDDMEIHDDDEFEQTLLQLDTSQPEQRSKRAKLDEASTSPKVPSLASKLSSRFKKEDTTVKETPDKKKSRTISDIEIVEETPKRTKTPVKKSPAKSSPKKKTPIKISPAKTKSPVRQTNTPKAAAKKSPEDKVSDQPAASGVTPKGGRGGPGYRSYLQRAPPSAIGSKEIPEGGVNCLEGLTFVISGVLESLERDDAKSLVEQYGGKVTTSISKRTSYIVLGRDAGISKTEKAEQFGTKQLDEDGLLDLVRTLPGKKSKYEINAELSAKKEKQATPKVANKPSLSKTPVASPSRPSPKPSPSVRPSPMTPKTSSSRSAASSPRVPPEGAEVSLMWVDKYKPTNLKQVIGQQGPKSNANKLLNWLKNWHKCQADGRKPAFSRFSDDGAGYRCALLSGPPGVGKTTTATLVCQEMGFSYVELNASDTRSKKSLDTVVSELLGNHTLVDFFGNTKGHNKATDGKQHCLIMDEVDGMAGNEDRGGMQELIALIKKSRIPIICMCNDRNHQKVRSLANYCFDLRFQRPRMEQIKAAMMSLAYKEGVKIPPPALNEVISAANQDVRQIIHNLSMWSVADKTLTHEQLKKDAAKATKDMKMGPFDVCRKVFVGGEETAKMTINDKSDLFFHDYSFGPLFVHENYIHAMPYAARGDKKKHLDCLSKAIDAIADGDLVDRKIRGSQNWSMLPTQAMFSSVIPGEVMRGGFNHMVTFPQWLGKNSSTNKTDRILQELHTHMSLKLSGDRRALNMDYVPHFRRCLSRPLVDKQNEGVPEVVSLLHEYDLLREDYDNILEISQWSHLKEPLAGVDSKTKAAFTRTYNKESHLTPYAAVQGAKKRRGGGGGETDLMGEEDAAVLANDDAESDAEDVSKDAMIKPAKKGKGRAAASTSTTAKGKGRGKAQTTTTRGRGRGRGRAK